MPEHELSSFLDADKTYSIEIEETNLKIGMKNAEKQAIDEYRTKLGIWDKIKHYWNNRKEAAKTGQLQFISACIFILFAINTSIEVNLLFVGWALSGTGIFAGVFCTNKVLSTEWETPWKKL